MGFWDVVAAHPGGFISLYVLTLIALVVIAGSRSVEATKQTQALAEAEAKVAEANIRVAEANVRAAQTRAGLRKEL